MKSDWPAPLVLLICGLGLAGLIMALRRSYKESIRWDRKRTEALRRSLDQSDELLRQLKRSNRLLESLSQSFALVVKLRERRRTGPQD
jgi:uncharacterized membrane-anchored protein YhcB (DUF1043 family)